MLNLQHIRLPRSYFSCEFDTTIEPGEKIILMGRSGSGKTSLLSLIAGFEAPTQGRITWKGKDLTAMEPQERPLTMLFQNHNLFPHLTVFENTGLGLKPNLSLTQQEKDQVMEILDMLGIKPLHDQLPSQLSGGEVQRTALARSLLRPTEILLLDEPFAALGPRMRQDLVELLLDIQKQRNLTILMATHHTDDAIQMGGRLLFMDKGHIQLDSQLPEALESKQVESYLAKH